MNRRQKVGPILSENGRQAAAVREARSAAALRQNLRRRKLQRQGQSDSEAPSPSDPKPRAARDGEDCEDES